MRHILRYIALLIAMEVVFSGIAFLLADWPWLAVFPAPVFLALVWLAGSTPLSPTGTAPGAAQRPLWPWSDWSGSCRACRAASGF